MDDTNPDLMFQDPNSLESENTGQYKSLTQMASSKSKRNPYISIEKAHLNSCDEQEDGGAFLTMPSKKKKKIKLPRPTTAISYKEVIERKASTKGARKQSYFYRDLPFYLKQMNSINNVTIKEYEIVNNQSLPK